MLFKFSSFPKIDLKFFFSDPRSNQDSHTIFDCFIFWVSYTTVQFSVLLVFLFFFFYNIDLFEEVKEIGFQDIPLLPYMMVS